MKQREFSQTLGHIWLGILPERFLYAPVDFLTCALNRSTLPETDEIRCACLRLTIHNWNHSSGVIGTRYTPQKTEQLVIRVPADSANPEPPINPTKLGHPLRFSRIILDEAIKTLEQENLPASGTLEFICGSYHPAHSNEKIFRILTKTALLLLDPVLDEASEEEIFATVTRVIEENR
jgi:hypothetical protein